MWFPIDTQSATVQNTVYEIDFGPYNTDRLLNWITLKGPAGSNVQVYIDTVFMDITFHGDFNRADYYKGIPIARGRQLRLVWSVGTGNPVPQASIGCDNGGTEGMTATGQNTSIFTAG